MGYVLKAVLSSAQHPEYGQITVPFPIPDEKYDRMIELLEPLEIGDALRQDCRVDELDSFYTVLNRLVGSLVNFDELDYLAKRLDSFDDGEAAQFQGMACKLGVSNIKDFINLTFCCQQATVITDFSDLDAIGRQHYMTMQGGGCRIEELERLDGRKFALDLILNHLEGRITPYGVVYDTTEWLNKYESIKDKLTCKVDLEAHFTEKVIGNMAVDVLDIGTVHFPTGQIFACDPLVELEDTLPFLQTIPAGTYPVKICVVPSEKYGDRYACVKVEVSREKPVRYELGMVGNENLDAALGDDDYFGFGVDAGMGCIADIQTQAAFKTYWAKRLEEDPDIDPYNDLFCDLLEENAQAHPKYQGDCGDWLNWTVPDTDCNLPIFSSGWGDGYYPVYFGYDAKGEVCAVYVRFIDIEASYKEQA